jgi:hypothetical protein
MTLFLPLLAQIASASGKIERRVSVTLLSIGDDPGYCNLVDCEQTSL